MALQLALWDAADEAPALLPVRIRLVPQSVLGCQSFLLLLSVELNILFSW